MTAPSRFTSFTCGRASTTCACGRPARFACDYPLAGSKTGLKCGKALCDRCRHRQPQEKTQILSLDYCRPHHDMNKRAELEATEGRPRGEPLL